MIDIALTAYTTFRRCRRNHAKSRAIFDYLFAHELRIARLPEPEVQAALTAIKDSVDSWYESRIKDHAFDPADVGGGKALQECNKQEELAQ